MKTYDWIVVGGGGITGAALGYELAIKGFSVLLLEKDPTSNNATRYSYGGTCLLVRQIRASRATLCQEGIELHRSLSQLLDSDTGFRELDLILTISAEDDPQALKENYTRFALPPRLLSIESSCELEPLLNRDAIAGAIRFPHAHIIPEKTAQAYLNAFRRAGGEIQITGVVQLLRQGECIKGVKTPNITYHAANTVICAGGISRALLKAVGIDVRLYFTHAEIIETPPVDVRLRTLVMPANTKRIALEAISSTAQLDPLWDEPG